MKIKDITPGTRILVTCPRCEHKRSLIFKDASTYRMQSERICMDCTNDDRAESNPMASVKWYKDYHTPDMR